MHALLVVNMADVWFVNWNTTQFSRIGVERILDTEKFKMTG